MVARFGKYIILSIVLILAIVWYFFYTAMGQKHSYSLLSYVASEQSGLQIDIQSLDIQQYPHIKTSLLIENTYQMNAEGLVKKLWSDPSLTLEYTLSKDKDQIHGDFNASLHDVELRGEGKLIEDIQSTITLQLHENTQGYAFDLEMHAKDASLHLSQGSYSPSKDEMHSTYALNIPNLSEFKTLLGADTHGAFQTNGAITLKNTHIDLKKKRIDTYIKLDNPKDDLVGQLHARLDDDKSKDISLQFDGIVKKYYNLTLDGLVNPQFINMDYTLKAKRVPSTICTIEDNMQLKGHLSGAYHRLHIRGEGKLFDGNVSYESIKVAQTLEQVNLKLTDINALKLATLLGYPKLPQGKANISMHFSELSHSQSKGHVDFNLSQAKYYKIPLALQASVDVNQSISHISSDISLGSSNIHIRKGKYYHDQKHTHTAQFTLDSKDISTFRVFLGDALHGSLYAVGKLQYNNHLELRAISKSYDGVIDFLYKNNMLYMDLDNISLAKFMAILPYPVLLDASVKGSINYDFHKDLLLVQTKLNQARFLKSSLVDNIYQKSSINLLKERFMDSTLKASYHNNTVLGDLRLKNKTSHFTLANVKINTQKEALLAYFDFGMQEQAFSGKIHGPLQNPSIDLDMEKLIKYQMDKQLDTYLGKENRKMMESMPMGDVAKDMAAEVGAEFMDIFF